MRSLHTSGSRYADEHVTIGVTCLEPRSSRDAVRRARRTTSPKSAARGRRQREPADEHPRRSSTAKRSSGARKTRATQKNAPCEELRTARRDRRIPRSLFRIFRSPWREQLERRQAFSKTTARGSGLGDTSLDGLEPTPEQIAFVKALNDKFRRLMSPLGATFRAYCGGTAGYMVRRFAPGCDEDDILSQNKPIGMGPKGLANYFQKHYGFSWSDFLALPSSELTVLLEKVTEKQAAEVPRPTATKRPAAARPRAPRAKASNAASGASSAAAPKERAPRTPRRAQSSAPDMTTMNVDMPREAATEPLPGNASNESADDKGLDAIAESMRELKELIAQSMTRK